MASGKIKKIVQDKGFGFIQTNEGNDIFFHHSAVSDHGFEQLREGQQVEYTVEANPGPKGPRAASVTPT